MLRDYQVDALSKIVAELETKDSLLYQLPTGGGKTVIATELIKYYIKQNKRVWFAVHRKELLDQTATRFTKEEIPLGMIAAEYPESDLMPLQVVMVQTHHARHKKKNFHEPDIVIIDEAHHAAADSYQSFPNCKKIGLSATPVLMGGNGLCDHFQDIIEGPSVKWLIDNHYLSPYQIKCPPSKFDRGQLKIKMGEYQPGEIQAALEQADIFGDAVENYKKFLNGKKAIVFCPTVKSSIDTANAFIRAGIPAAHIDAETPKLERNKIIEQFRLGEILVLCNVNIISEGFDVPDCDGVILLRPTMSLSLYLQQVGRALRYVPGKIAMILDHVRNCFEHDEPAAHREWSEYFFKKKQPKEKIVSMQACGECFTPFAASANQCPFCGWTKPVEEKRETKYTQEDGTLVDFNPELVKAKKQKNKNKIFMEKIIHCMNVQDCRALAIEIGNKPGAGSFYWRFLCHVRSVKPTSLLQYKNIARSINCYEAMAYLFYNAFKGVYN